MKHLSNITLAIIALLILGLAISYFTEVNVSTSAKIESVPAMKDFMKEDIYVKPEPENNQQLDNAINSIINEHKSANVRVSIQDISKSKLHNYGDISPDAAASVTKLVTVAMFLQKVEQKKYALNEYLGEYTADELLTKLIHFSDQAAWNQLRKLLTYQGLNEYANSVGVGSYESNSNVISVGEMNDLLVQLYDGKLLDEAIKYLLNLLKKGDENYPIEFGLPEGVNFNHKIGWLPDRLHLTAVIEQNGQAVAITVFSKTSGEYNFTEGKLMLAKLTQAAYNNLLKEN